MLQNQVTGYLFKISDLTNFRIKQAKMEMTSGITHTVN